MVITLLLVGFHALSSGQMVVVRTLDGRVLAREPLPESGAFELRYVHSYYREPAIEHFAASKGEGFTLVAVTSANEAVLDYYEMEGTRSRLAEGMLRMAPDRPQRFEKLPLKATSVGRRTLSVGEKRVALFRPDGKALSVGITVETWSRWRTWWRSWSGEVRSPL